MMPSGRHRSVSLITSLLSTMRMTHRPMMLMLIGMPRRLRMHRLGLECGMILADRNGLADQAFNRLQIGNFLGIAER